MTAFTDSGSAFGIERGRSLLYLAVALSLLAGLAHLGAMPHHLEEWWGYGAFFLVASLVQGVYGVVLLRWPTRTLLASGIAFNTALIALYVMTRTAGVPFFGPHAGMVEKTGTLDLACVAAELALVLALVLRGGFLSALRPYFVPVAAQAFGVGLVTHLLLHSGVHEAHGVSPVLHWLEYSALMVPLAALSVWIAVPLSRRFAAFFYGEKGGDLSSRIALSVVAAAAYAAASVPTNGLAAQHAEAGSFAAQAGRDASVVLVASFLLLLIGVTLGKARPRALSFWRPRILTAAAAVAASLLIVAGPTVLGHAFSEEAEAQQAPGASCAPGSSYDRSYDVAAVNVHIPYNRWGNVDPHGQMYVLQQDKEAVKNWHMKLGPTPAADPAGAENRRLRPRPLVIRANAGECVRIDFTNELNEAGGDGLPNDPRASMKVFGPAYDAQTSDGSAVGYNDDTTVPNEDDPATPQKDNKITYFWKAPSQEGSFLFRDQGATAGSEANSGSLAHGLYGAFVVEPAGSVWKDPVSGKQLYTETNDVSGDLYIDADIIVPNKPAFRESIQVSQDELPFGFGMGFNYGAEPQHNRIATNPAGQGNTEQFAPDSVGEETSLSSWAYGDPALIKLASGEEPWLPKPDPNGPGRISPEDCGLGTPGFNSDSCYVSNVTHAYPGDPSKIRYTHAGVKETHVFHMHTHQWLAEQDDRRSTTIDSQTYGPGESFTADLIGGAGSKPGTFGDSIFHCHLYPHFADGFWSLFRVHDVLEDGTKATPDGVKVRNLMPLPDRTAQAPPAPTANNPGFPRFIPGEFGWRAPQPPGGVSEQRQDDPATAGANESEDDPTTVEREDLEGATRVVAGRPLDATLDPTDPMEKELSKKLAVEKRVVERNTGAAFNPGAPFVEPCPTGSREVTYNVSAIQTDITYNEAGWHDKQGRMLVLSKDVDDILAGRKEPEPLFFRVNAGDCINFNVTNRLPNWFGGDEFQQLAQTNMLGEHIHLVKFDVLASDGASNGWNYQQAAFTKEQADFNKDRDSLTNNVNNCNWQGCRIPEPASWDPSTAGAPPGQTIHERWYADYELRTAFTHDHHFAALDQNRGLFGALIVEPKNMDFRNPKTGEFYQPINNAANGPVCATTNANEPNKCTGDAAGTKMDVIGPGQSDDFREFGLGVQDFVSLHKSDADGGAPISAPDAPEEFPDDDPGTMAINYKNAPFSLRDTDESGRPTDPAHVFSSTVHGDPATPLLEAYSEDPVRVRVIQGSHEEQHVMTFHGMRWHEEPNDPKSPLINSKAIGVSEAFNFEVPRIECGPNDETCAGDYLYSGTATDDLYLGVWGLMRARGKEVPSLLPLPDNVPQAEGQSFSTQGLEPPEANSPGTPCPSGVPVKKYNVVAMKANIKYNKDGDHDPYGLMYVAVKPGETLEQAMERARANPEPMVLRANQGDCVEVRLHNRLTQQWLDEHGNAGTNGDPTLPTEPLEGTPAGLRVSLHPQLVRYDVRGSDGTAVGYNRDQTVAPGDSRLYRWYADKEVGTTNLTDFGDVRGHRHHGLFAGLNIEPRGATYHDPTTGEEISSGASADVRLPGENDDFREFTLFFQDGLNLRDQTGAIIEDPLDHPPTPEEPEGEGLDAEDMGEKGFNYANAPFANRIGDIPETGMDGHKMAHVFDSRVHGDPDTPILRTYAGDRVRMRVLQGADKPRQNSFQLSGHSWKAQPHDPNSTLIGNQGGMSVGRTYNVYLGNAGGGHVGDYMYGTGVGFHQLPGGLWGIMRSYPQPPAGMPDPSPLREVDDPRAQGNYPIMPLEISESATSVTLGGRPGVVAFGKATTLSGKLAMASGEPLGNRQVTLEQKPAGAATFAKVASKATSPDGSFSFAGVKPKKNTLYRVRFGGSRATGLQASEGTAEVKVRARVILSTSTETLKLGQRRAISGAVIPAHAGTVRLIVERNGEQVLSRNLKLASSRYKFSYKPNAPGRYSVRATFAGDDDHAGGNSPIRSFVVRR